MQPGALHLHVLRISQRSQNAAWASSSARKGDARGSGQEKAAGRREGAYLAGEGSRLWDHMDDFRKARELANAGFA